jgi:hypothetical protein
MLPESRAEHAKAHVHTVRVDMQALQCGTNTPVSVYTHTHLQVHTHTHTYA